MAKSHNCSHCTWRLQVIHITKNLDVYMFLDRAEYVHSFSDLELKPVGVLEVKLVEARDLKNKDLVGKSDPFAVLYIRPLREKTKKSKTIVSGLLCLV